MTWPNHQNIRCPSLPMNSEHCALSDWPRKKWSILINFCPSGKSQPRFLNKVFFLAENSHLSYSISDMYYMPGGLWWLTNTWNFTCICWYSDAYWAPFKPMKGGQLFRGRARANLAFYKSHLKVNHWHLTNLALIPIMSLNLNYILWKFEAKRLPEYGVIWRPPFSASMA